MEAEAEPGVIAMGAWPRELRNEAVRMRDGCVLRADVFLHAGDAPLPCLLYRTPYNKELAPREWTVFEKIRKVGLFGLVIVDVRGRYASDGVFNPYFQEGEDGHDSIEWVAQQSFCNGRVGTFGVSFPGACQWMAAKSQPRPSHLVAAVPAFTYADPAAFIYFGGVFDSSWVWWTLTCIAADARKRRGLAGPQTDEEADAAFEVEKERIQNHRPLVTLPDLRDSCPFYYEWLAHPPEDRAYWEPLDLTVGEVPRLVLRFSVHCSGEDSGRFAGAAHFRLV
jgi:putative CocE/NonD family hydrolase